MTRQSMEEQEQNLDASIPDSASDRPDRLPSIRILDLMVLTAAMAFVFAIQNQMMNTQPEMYQSTAWLIVRIVNSVPAGIAFASIFWIVTQKRITGRCLIQPGHWVLASYALIATISLGSYFLLHRHLEFNSPGSLTILLVSLGLTSWAASLLLVRGLFHTPIRWWGVIVSMAISFAVTGLTYLLTVALVNSPMNPAMSWLQIVGYGKFAADIICILCLIIAMVVDFRKRTSRDWLHWAGTLVLFLSIAVEPIVRIIMFRFFDSQFSGL